MKRTCPTIQELLALDAVARYKSISLAADALCVTVSAVSKQLSGMERFLGHALLEKNGRGVQLTRDGMMYWQRIATSLRTIEAASFELRSAKEGAGVLTLASAPTFLTKWLIPRLPEFRRLHPAITLSFSQHLGAFDTMPAGVDAAIRYGSGAWPGMTADYIAGKAFVVVASPTLFCGALHFKASDLGNFTLLQHEEASTAWLQWAERSGLTASRNQSGPRFAQYSSVIQAAVSGLGVGLVPRILVADEITQGVLATLDEPPLVIEQGHYFCYRPESGNAPILNAFREWILAEGRRMTPVASAKPS